MSPADPAGFPGGVRAISGRAWRLVEAQHRVATLKLVDTVAEQEVLEQIIEDAKPPRPAGPAFERLHYLLLTPFRYPPLRHGTRYGRRSQRGLFYGSREPRTAMAEVAYYRLWFLHGTRADLPYVDVELTLFRVGYRTPRGADLTRDDAAHLRAELVSRTSYVLTQHLGDAMRAAGVEAFRAPSARDPEGVVIGILDPRAFAAPAPDPGSQTWLCTTTRTQVVFHRRDLLAPEEVVFARAAFLIDGELPAPPG